MPLRLTCHDSRREPARPKLSAFSVATSVELICGEADRYGGRGCGHARRTSLKHIIDATTLSAEQRAIASGGVGQRPDTTRVESLKRVQRDFHVAHAIGLRRR